MSPRKGGTASYSWGGKQLRFVRCAACGCVTHWEPVNKAKRRRMGINMRNFDPEVVDAIRVRRLDGAKTWKFLA